MPPPIPTLDEASAASAITLEPAPAFALPSVKTPSRLADYYELTKPRMNFLVVVTTVLGFYIAAKVAGQTIVSWSLLHTLMGTALTAASASVLNQYIERDLDRLMPRTRNRPLAAGRVTTLETAIFATVLGIAGVVWLAVAVNALTALLGAVTLMTYVLVYTPLKRRSPLCTLVGAVPGAIPPMMGVTGFASHLTPLAWTLFAILFVWQLPHFFALALMYKKDYAAGGFKMLPLVEDGDARTRRQIVLFTLLLLPISLMPVFASNARLLYGGMATLLGAWFLFAALRCYHGHRGSERKLFLVSIIYLPLILTALMVDQ
ncbi:MAG: heme o synthase [Tepidisphaeraceae bacterium]